MWLVTIVLVLLVIAVIRDYLNPSLHMCLFLKANTWPYAVDVQVCLFVHLLPYTGNFCNKN